MVHHSPDTAPGPPALAVAERSEEGRRAGQAVLLLDRRRELRTSGCARWPEGFRLLSSEGELVRGRCKATNLCAYCQSLYVRETVEMLVLDAMEGAAPAVWGVLTAREHLTRAELNGHLRTIRQRMKREGWSVEWFVQVEFQRRGALHANLLVKVDRDRAEAWWARVVELWCARVDAEPVGQWLGAVGEVAAIAKYLGKMLGHGLKAEQAPPVGWKGHRTSHTREYFTAGTVAARARARQSLRHKRALAVLAAAGHGAHDAELLAHEQMTRDAATTWVLATRSGARFSTTVHDPNRVVTLANLRATRPVDVVDVARRLLASG